MRQTLCLVALASLALMAACHDTASAASYSSSYSSRSYSSPSYSSRSYSSPSYSSRSSYSAPSYSAPRPSVAPAASSSYRPTPAYTVRSTTTSSSYTPAGKATATAPSSRYTAAPSSTVINHTTIVRSPPVIVHQYGHPGGYYSSGTDAFFHGYFLASMFNRPGYGPVYAQPAGVSGDYGQPVLGSPGWNLFGAIAATAFALLFLGLAILMIRAALD